MAVNVGQIHMGTLESIQGKEVENFPIEEPASELSFKLTTIELNGDEFWPLSGRPYLDIVLAKTHLKPSYQLAIPADFTSELPSLLIPTFLTYKGKEWEVVYYGNACLKRFDPSWKNFVIDNKLEIGDACVFELMDCSTKILKFRVQILRGSIPSKFMEDSNGASVDKPIIL